MYEDAGVLVWHFVLLKEKPSEEEFSEGLLHQRRNKLVILEALICYTTQMEKGGAAQSYKSLAAVQKSHHLTLRLHWYVLGQCLVEISIFLSSPKTPVFYIRTKFHHFWLYSGASTYR